MAPEALHNMTALEQRQVSPLPSPSGTKPRALPLTFFDLVFWDIPPVQRLFFYDNADVPGVPEFLLHELPRFEKSLAMALHHFYPLAGKLSCGSITPESAAPELVFSDGDSVRLTVAAGAGDEFHDLAGDHARDTARLRPLLPRLTRDGVRLQDVFAVQITVFPHAGMCIGTTLHHAVADGSSYLHFMKTWAAIHRLGGPGCSLEAVPVMGAAPLFDRSVVQDEDGLREEFLRDHADKRLLLEDDREPGSAELATFRFTDELLLRLGRKVESETSARRCSSYALACGAVWAGIMRARGGGSTRFGFVTGCRPRTSPPVPGNYFGNCLGLCRVEDDVQELSCGGGGGVITAAAMAAAAIWRAIEGLAEEGRVFRGARGWVRLVREYACAGAGAVTVAGSPKLGVYAATDLGAPWGRPRKVEIVSVERTGALALAENGPDTDGGGIEVGVALPRAEMEAFRAFYVDLVANLQY